MLGKLLHNLTYNNGIDFFYYLVWKDIILLTTDQNLQIINNFLDYVLHSITNSNTVIESTKVEIRVCG